VSGHIIFFFLYLSRKYAPENTEMRARSHSKNGGIFSIKNFVINVKILDFAYFI